jgi:hypothetical protein
MKKQSIDSLFAQKLQQAEIAPRQEAWAKLQGRMTKKEEKIIWLPYFRWSAAASVVLLAGFGIWFLNGPSKTTNLALTNNAKSVKRTILQKNDILKTGKIELHIANNQSNNTKNKVSTSIEISKPKRVIQQGEVIIAKNEPVIVEPPIKKVEIVVPEPSLQTIAVIEPIKKQEQTVILELSEPVDVLPENGIITLKSTLVSNLPKEKRINKIFRQLKNLKNGDDVDWQEVGVKSPKLLARLNNEK